MIPLQGGRNFLGNASEIQRKARPGGLPQPEIASLRTLPCPEHPLQIFRV